MNTTKTLIGNVGANSFSVQVNPTDVIFTVTDNAVAPKIRNGAHGKGTSTAPGRIVACMAAGTLGLYLDGTSIGATSGAGTALWSANNTPLAIGNNGGVQYLDGSISNVKVYPNATYRSGM
jgi:hypothetical protein